MNQWTGNDGKDAEIEESEVQVAKTPCGSEACGI